MTININLTKANTAINLTKANTAMIAKEELPCFVQRTSNDTIYLAVPVQASNKYVCLSTDGRFEVTHSDRVFLDSRGFISEDSFENNFMPNCFTRVKGKIEFTIKQEE